MNQIGFNGQSQFCVSQEINRRSGFFWLLSSLPKFFQKCSNNKSNNPRNRRENLPCTYCLINTQITRLFEKISECIDEISKISAKAPI
ncbi:MAG: hypothetical protein CMK43_04060 [Porticoccaceae bacterium]|nr:hypothetical protein [Porticoccaceae bacterium]